MNESLPDGAQWARACTTSLDECLQLGTVAGAAEWSRRWSLLSRPEHVRIWDIDLSARDMSGFNLSRCKLKNVKFIGANLSDASFAQSILRECDLTRAILMGASFREADLKSSILRNVQIDNRTDMAVTKGRLTEDADLMLKERAEAAWARSEFEFDLSRGSFHRTLVRAIDYGENLPRLLALAAIVVAAFAVLFWVAGPGDITWAVALVYSLQYFVALGDPFADNCFAMSLAGTIEACLGLVFLALLLSSITKHLVLAR